MSARFEPDPEEQRRQSQAHLLMLRVGLALIDDARRRGGFETDEQKLTAQVAELAPGEAVEASPFDADRVMLSADCSDSSSIFATLRKDGVLLEQGVSFGVTLSEENSTELSTEELEKLERMNQEFEAGLSQPRFTGERFLRAAAAEPQPGHEVQVLAAELFADGVVIHCTSNSEPESSEPPSLESFFNRELQLKDDLGTKYYGGDGGGGGVQVTHGSYAFSPAVPAEARLLQVITRSGSIEISL